MLRRCVNGYLRYVRSVQFFVSIDCPGFTALPDRSADCAGRDRHGHRARPGSLAVMEHTACGGKLGCIHPGESMRPVVIDRRKQPPRMALRRRKNPLSLAAAAVIVRFQRTMAEPLRVPPYEPGGQVAGTRNQKIISAVLIPVSRSLFFLIFTRLRQGRPLDPARCFRPHRTPASARQRTICTPAPARPRR